MPDHDSVAAIDQAVADGVDVINFSISGTLTNFRDPVEIAFMYAADAGVFVAASAGNSGPTTSTVAHPGPWLTTVAAGTHNRDGNGSVTLGNGVTYFGASVATAVGPAPLIDSTAAGLPGADPTQVALCYLVGGRRHRARPGQGRRQDRGLRSRRDARVNKSLAVQEAGGVGMVLVNTSANSLNADFHFVPTVHLQNTDRAAVKAYAATDGRTATINQATIIYDRARAVHGVVLLAWPAARRRRRPAEARPDCAGPGHPRGRGASGQQRRVVRPVQRYVDVEPARRRPRGAVEGGAPELVADGDQVGADDHRNDVLDGGISEHQLDLPPGRGHVKPNSALDPGLVYDSGWNDWLAFICATQPQGLDATCNALWSLGYSKDPSDFNSPSIAIGDLAGVQTVKRKVTNVSGGR